MKTTKSTITSTDEVSKLVRLVIIITVIFLIFYVVTIFITMEKEEELVTTPATVQYDNILTSNLLNRHPSEYYVLITSSDKYVVGIYDAYLTNYDGMTDAIRVYRSDLNNPFNSKYISDESNVVNDIETLKFSTDTLVKVKDSKIVETYEGKEDIVTYLQELTKEVEE